MTKAKITVYVILIFLAGAVAGGAVARKVWPQREHRPGPHRPDPQKFEDHLFGIMKERLKLTPEQIEKIEPIFHAGFKEVKTIQDKTLAQIEDAVQQNHAQIAKELTADQKTELEKMDQERREFFKNHPGRHGPPHGPPGEQFRPSPSK
jgi:Spy/CpxP family protein refolding chaperone